VTRDGKAWIGAAAAGHTDLFGPVVVIAVAVTDATASALLDAGVTNTDADTTQMADLAAAVASSCPHAAVSVSPSRYNELLADLGSRDPVLAWAHARAIEDLLGEIPCGSAIVERFCDERTLQRALMTRASRASVLQGEAASTDAAVAAAALIASAMFDEELTALSSSYDMALPKGTGTGAAVVREELLRRHGAGVLAEVAKLDLELELEDTGR